MRADGGVRPAPLDGAAAPDHVVITDVVEPARKVHLADVGHAVILVGIGRAVVQHDELDREVWHDCLLVGMDMKKPAGQGGRAWLSFAGD